MKKPYQIESQRAVKRFEQMATDGNPAVQMVLPLAEMVGWLRKGVGELHAQVIHTIPAKFSHGRSLRQVRADPPGRIVFQYGNLARLYKALKPPYAWPAIPRAIRYKTLTSVASAFPSGGS